MKNVKCQSGQALVTLLVFTIVAITITSAAVIILFTNSLGTSKLEQGTNTYYSAESGAENALLRLLRDPNYTGETLAVDNASVVISVANAGNTYTITSDATLGNFLRSVEVTASFVNNILTVDTWKEVF
jgi:FlaG/FlaF family flagellin (archaellin)